MDQQCNAGCQPRCYDGTLCPVQKCGNVGGIMCRPVNDPERASPSCGSGFILYGDMCYSLVTSPANYLQAILSCARMDNATLVLIKDEEQQNIVSRLPITEAGAWIGSTAFPQEEGSFFWLDESSPEYTNWRFVC